MFPNSANLAMGHELIGLCRLEQNLSRLEEGWPDGAYVLRRLLSGQTRMTVTGSLPSPSLPRHKDCHTRSCAIDTSARWSKRTSFPVRTPGPWERHEASDQ